MESVCEERRTENCRSQSRRLISCDATAARRTWDEVRASRDMGYLEEAEMKDSPERYMGDAKCVGDSDDNLYEFHTPSMAIKPVSKHEGRWRSCDVLNALRTPEELHETLANL